MEINANNYKEVLLQWLEGELSPTEVLQAEAFILVNEAAAREWKLLQKTRLQPTAQVFFPKKHLLMKEEEEVVAAPIAVAEVAEKEAVVRTISGGFNYRKLAIPMGIAASLLLFFLFFNNKNLVENNGKAAVAKVENLQPESDNKTGNTKQELAAKQEEKASDKAIITSQNNTVEDQVASNNTSSNKIGNNKKPVTHQKQNQAFLATNIYGKNALEENTPKRENMALVKIEPLVLETNPEIKNTTLLKKSLARQNQENIKWQKALEEKENALVNAQNEDVERGIVGTLTHFFSKNVQIKKHRENDVNYYAFRLETQKITIVKTFKSTF
jgi:hypothetical protein